MVSSKEILFCLGIAVITMIMLAVLYFDIRNGKIFPKSDICLTDACMAVNDLYNQYVDKSYNPCENFEKFACTAYVTKLEEEDKYGSGLEDSTVSAFARQIELLNEPILNSDRLLASQTKQFYRSCLNPDVEKNTYDYMLKQINKIRPVPIIDPGCEIPDWIDFLKKVIHAGTKSKSLLNIYLDLEKKNFRDIFPFITRAYLSKLNDNKRAARKDALKNVFDQMGFTNSETIEQDLDDEMDFQNELVDLISSSKDKLSDIKTIGALKEKCQNVDWNKLFNILYEPHKEVEDDTTIKVYHEKYLCELYDKITGKEKAVINHIFTRHVEYLLETIHKYIPPSKIQAKSSRCDECAKIINDAYPFGSSYVYMIDKDTELGTGARDEISRIINTDARYGSNWEVLNESTWISEETRHELGKKISSVVFHFGFLRYDKTILEQIPEYEEIFESAEFSEEDPLQNTLEINKAIRNRLGREGGSVFLYIQLLRPKTVDSINANAWYLPNNILLTYALMAPLTYKHLGPSYHNYGAIGYVGSHEYGHMFDQAHYFYNADNVTADYWDEESKAEYEKRVQCLIDVYNEVEDPCTGTKISGEKTKYENFADLYGIRLSRRLYERWYIDNGYVDLKLKDYSEYTPDQLFWISASILLCERRSKEKCEQWNKRDPHTIGPVRILMNAKMSPHFGKDWNCPVGSEMHPIKKCKVF